MELVSFKRDPESSLSLPPCEDTARKPCLLNRRWLITRQGICQFPNLRLPVLRTVRNKFILFMIFSYSSPHRLRQL